LRAAPVSILLAALAATASAAAPPLRPLAYAPLPAGAVLPASWLQRELRLQGDGLGGELRRFWPGFTNSMWLGGNDTEWDFMDMFPYIVNGFVGQAILLGDAAQLADAAAYVDGVLEMQRGQGGWLGPTARETRRARSTSRAGPLSARCCSGPRSRGTRASQPRASRGRTWRPGAWRRAHRQSNMTGPACGCRGTGSGSTTGSSTWPTRREMGERSTTRPRSTAQLQHQTAHHRPGHRGL
jgi:hypothetical protein